jgi:hypothetical protein
MADYRLGWHKDKYDDKDYLHRPKVGAKVTAPVNNADLLPEVRDQGHVGACIGFGIGTNVCGVAKYLSIFTEWYSPTWIYNGARFIEGTLPYDGGAYPRDALDWLVGNGCLLEHFWPYNPDALDPSAPSSDRMAEAIRYPDFQYFRVDNGLDGIVSALSERHLVSLGSPWFNKWFDCPADGILPIPVKSDYGGGGHEYCLYGADQDAGLLWAQNSWGTAWGKAGRFAIPMESLDVFKQLGGYDAHYFVFSPLEPVPPVPPEPTPSKCVFGNGIARALNIWPTLMGRRGRFYYRNP